MTDRRGIELFARDYPHDYPEVEAILLMHTHRLRSCEIPVVMRPRLTGESAISSTQSVYYMIKVLLAVFVALFRTRPDLGGRGGRPPASRRRRHDRAGPPEDDMVIALSQLAQQRIEVIVLAVIVCGLIFELIRRKRLMERYAILWLMAGRHGARARAVERPAHDARARGRASPTCPRRCSRSRSSSCW